jgi:acetoin utilization protein AcuB
MPSEPITVADYMTRLPSTVGTDQPMSLAYRFMREHHCRHLPVLARGRVVGVVSERDLNLMETLSDVDPDVVTVEEAMTADPYCTSKDTPLAEVAAQMAERKLGCCVVLDGNHVSGILTTVDVCRALSDVLRTRADLPM